MAGITEAMVVDAAAKLTAEGVPPTIDAVRKRLGRGSYTTINQYLRPWREQSLAKPPDVLKILAKFVRVEALEDHFRALAADQYAALRLMADNEVAQIAARMDKVEDMNRRAMAGAEELRGELRRVAAEKATLEKQLTVCETQASMLRDALAAQEHTLQDVRGELFEWRQLSAAREAAIDQMNRQVQEQNETIARLQELLAVKPKRTKKA